MTYEYFLMHLEQKILERLEKGEVVKRVQVLKNNGVELDGFSYYVEGHRERPTVYVNHHYQEELSEEELADVADAVLKTQRECRLLPRQGVEQMMDFDAMRKRVCCRLISRERNEALLEELPWLPWLDLAIVFYLQVPRQVVEHATAVIHTSHMEYWGVTLEDLCHAAAENMAKVRILLEPMETFLGDLGFEPLSSGMHILSNSRKLYGAGVIIDPGVQHRCLEQLGESFYILPSSVHELILLPESLATTRTELDQLVQEVNEACVSQEEYLSDHAYYYSAATGMIE